MCILFITTYQFVKWIILLFVVFGIIILRSVKKQKRLIHQLETRNQELKSISEGHISEIDQINKKSKKHDNLSEFKDEVIQLLLHDLKNPLNLVLNYEYLPKELLGHTANQMLNIVTSIEDVQNYEKTKMYADIEEIQVLNILKNAYDQVEPLFKLKKINYYNAVDEGLKVYADKKILERILVNLLLNAEKFSQPGKDITVTAENKNDKVKISITDSGYRIPEDIHKLIFDKFGLLIAKKSNPTRAGNLGLCYCKLAIDAHNEEIGIDSIGKKTAFWFTLKVVDINKNLITKPKPQFDKQKANLSDESKFLLKESIGELKLLKVYEFSAIRNIIKHFEDSEDAGIIAWLTNIKLAVKSGDEDEYNDLIKQAE